MRLSFLAVLPLLLSSCTIPIKQTLMVGEHLTGTIIDGETKVAIPQAEIRYTLIDDYYTTSDSAGVFAIEPKELRNCVLRITERLGLSDQKWHGTQLAAKFREKQSRA